MKMERETYNRGVNFFKGEIILAEASMTKSKQIVQTMVPILPGLALSTGVAILGKGLAIFLPQLGGATLAILLGIVFGNTFFKQPALAVGTKFSESRLLEYSVVLLGATVTFQTITEMGLKGVAFIALQMTVTILFAYNMGRKLKLSRNASLMMAGGNAVCGSSAIASIAPTIHADDQEKGQIITLVNLLGTIMMLTLPFLGLSLFGSNLLAKSALLGGTLQSVGQVVAGASLLDKDVVQYAMLFKIMRIMGLVFVVLLFEKFVQRKDNATLEAVSAPKKKRLPLPWYVLGFLILCILNSSLTVPEPLANSAHAISGWFETIALAAIGLRLDFSKFLKEGPKFLLYALAVGAVQTICAVTLISLFHI